MQLKVHHTRQHYKMKFLSLVLATLLVSSSDAAYTPIRTSLKDLQTGKAEDVLRQALFQVGMISITNIFDESHLDLKTLDLLPSCIEHSSDSIEHVFDDGTIRRTMATHSAGTKASQWNLADENPNCQQFKATSQIFREAVGQVLDTFATELAIALNLDASKSLIQDEYDHGYSLKRIFDQGDHLEHFHCYYSNSDIIGYPKEETTIEWHTDQGMVLAFTPGLINGQTTDGFYIQLEDGSTEMVQFDQTDDLVLLLGDGVHQYVNGALKSPLRALPHAFRMPHSTDPRVWYGRMVLPPANAKHPLYPSMTFGEIREGMIAENPKASAMGCSQTHQVARELQDTACETGIATYCWHRCMNHTDYSVSEQICADQNKVLACMNEDGYLWPYIHDPQFTLGCANPNAVNWTVTADEESKDNEDSAGNSPNSTTSVDSSTDVLSVVASMVLGTIATVLCL